MPLLQVFHVANMSFNAFRENKILAKISEFTVATFEEGHTVNIPVKWLKLGDNCIQNCYLGRYIFGYTVGN